MIHNGGEDVEPTKSERAAKKGRWLAVFGIAVVALITIFNGKSENAPRAAAPVATNTANLAQEHDEIAVYLTPCDNAWEKLGSFMRSGSGTPLEGYQLASASERICDDSWSKLREVEKRDDRAVTDETIEVCQISANNRTRASKAIGAVFDGDTRPSAMTNANELVRGAEAAIAECKNTLAALEAEGAS